MKIDRAKEHLDALNVELAAWYKTEPCRMTAEDYPQESLYLIRIHLTIPPKRLGLIAADTLYCLRSALDQLAWQLALLTTATPYDRTEFPIFTAENNTRFEEFTQNIPATAVAAIEALQPYHRGAGYKKDLLWQLNALCNLDKHRVIPVGGMFLEFKVPEVPGLDMSSRWISFDNGDQGLVLPLDLKAQMDRAPKPVAGVLFGSKDTVAIDPGELSRLYDNIRDNRIPRFAGFFSQAPNP